MATNKTVDMGSEEFRKEHPEFFQDPLWIKTPALTGEHIVYIAPVAPANAEQPAMFDQGTRTTEYVDPAVGEVLFNEAQAAEDKAAAGQ